MKYNKVLIEFLAMILIGFAVGLSFADNSQFGRLGMNALTMILFLFTLLHFSMLRKRFSSLGQQTKIFLWVLSLVLLFAYLAAVIAEFLDYSKYKYFPVIFFAFINLLILLCSTFLRIRSISKQ